MESHICSPFQKVCFEETRCRNCIEICDTSCYCIFYGSIICGDWQVGPPYGALQYGAVSAASEDVLMSIPMGLLK